MAELSDILKNSSGGGQLASAELLPLVYDELWNLAKKRMATSGPGQTLQATALVHEAWLKLSGDEARSWSEQQAPVKRKVALKIIRLGMDTEQVIARFAIEREALALMDHPNIARVLDAGSTAAGRPYFVMELVNGEKITEFCDHHRLGLRQRLELFVLVCGAIQHAHQKGVIHRDIKPSNVLVREHEGRLEPKVIDFGIAKATAGELGAAGTVTQSGQLIGTPAYMSPEQAEGSVDRSLVIRRFANSTHQNVAEQVLKATLRGIVVELGDCPDPPQGCGINATGKRREIIRRIRISENFCVGWRAGNSTPP